MLRISDPNNHSAVKPEPIQCALLQLHNLLIYYVTNTYWLVIVLFFITFESPLILGWFSKSNVDVAQDSPWNSWVIVFGSFLQRVQLRVVIFLNWSPQKRKTTRLPLNLTYIFGGNICHYHSYFCESDTFKLVRNLITDSLYNFPCR